MDPTINIAASDIEDLVVAREMGSQEEGRPNQRAEPLIPGVPVEHPGKRGRRTAAQLPSRQMLINLTNPMKIRMSGDLNCSRIKKDMSTGQRGAVSIAEKRDT